MSTLVTYFSASGVTKAIAEQIKEELGADIYEIKPLEPYTKADLNWMNPFSRSSKEMKNKSSRPEIIEDGIDLSKYDTIFVGFPIWWGIAPTIINTFVEKYDFTGKTIYPFATSGGSGYGKSNELISQSLNGKGTLKEGKLINRFDKDGLRSWIIN